MEDDVKVTKNYTHKVVDLSNGGVAVFLGSEDDCKEFLNRNKTELTDLVISQINNIL